MRLLKRLSNGVIQLATFTNDDDLPPYGILSHTWIEDQEVTYGEIVTGRGQDKSGYKKIEFCLDRSRASDLDYCWVDTCCIDKSNAQEVQMAINSMFRYYERARECYVYLSDVQVPDEVTVPLAFPITWEGAFRRSRWFTRGWTLQELIAPGRVLFFTREGRRMGSKISLERQIYDITNIPVEVLRGQERLCDIGVEERLRWVSKRTTTLKEDRVYCLLGIFGVFLPLIYGEGEENAFRRLRKELQERFVEEDNGREPGLQSTCDQTNTGSWAAEFFNSYQPALPGPSGSDVPGTQRSTSNSARSMTYPNPYTETGASHIQTPAPRKSLISQSYELRPRYSIGKEVRVRIRIAGKLRMIRAKVENRKQEPNDRWMYRLKDATGELVNGGEYFEEYSLD